MRLFEWLTFRTATVSIATNDSFAAIARGRGGMAPRTSSWCARRPGLETFAIRPPEPALKQGFAHLIGWVGVIGQQEGLDLLVAAADHLIRGLGRADVRFAIVGFGPHLPVIEAEVAPAGSGRISASPGRSTARTCSPGSTPPTSASAPTRRPR